MTDTPMLFHLILLQSHEEDIISILLEMKAEQTLTFPHWIFWDATYIKLKFNKYLLFQTS